MKTEREKIYDQLLIDFAEFVRFRGGWASEFGTELDGILWKIAERFDGLRGDSELLKALLKAERLQLGLIPSLLPGEKEV